MPFCLLSVLPKSAVKFAVKFSKRLMFMRPVCECSANVITLFVPTKFKNPNGSNTFGVFLCYKIRICQKDTVENRSKIRVLVKNLN